MLRKYAVPAPTSERAVVEHVAQTADADLDHPVGAATLADGLGEPVALEREHAPMLQHAGFRAHTQGLRAHPLENDARDLRREQSLGHDEPRRARSHHTNI